MAVYTEPPDNGGCFYIKEGAISKRIAIWGSTGSIGTQTLDIVSLYPKEYSVDVLTCHTRIEQLFDQARQFRPRTVIVTGLGRTDRWEKEFAGIGVKPAWGRDALLEAAAEQNEDIALNALVGRAGLEPTLLAVDAGKDIALANKEVLVMAGSIVSRRVREKGVRLLPVDSEHSAVFQCLAGEDPRSVRRIILTASGGPFLDTPKSEFPAITIDQALNHPNWSMGKKVTIDSATMMNKGFEVIEAKYLFDIEAENIDVAVHPESIIHSMVEFSDGSLKAQMGNPDMHVPILYALTCPGRKTSSWGSIDFSVTGNLTFREPDIDKFECLGLAFKALSMGGTAPAVLNGADEKSVELFLQGAISFDAIPRLVREALENHTIDSSPDISAVLNADMWARNFVAERYSKQKDAR